MLPKPEKHGTEHVSFPLFYFCLSCLRLLLPWVCARFTLLPSFPPKRPNMASLWPLDVFPRLCLFILFASPEDKGGNVSLVQQQEPITVTRLVCRTSSFHAVCLLAFLFSQPGPACMIKGLECKEINHCSLKWWHLRDAGDYCTLQTHHI